MDFINILDDLLNEKQIGKVAFLRDLGYSKNAYSEWKSGFTKSYMGRIDEIADYFDVSTDYLLGRAQKKETLDAPLLPVEVKLLEKFNALPETAKFHILKYIDLLESEKSFFAVGPLSPERAQELLALTQEIYPDQSIDSRKGAG